MNPHKSPPISTNSHKFCFLLIFILLCLLSCSRNKSEAELGPEEEFKIAMLKFEAKNYDKAIGGFKRIVFRFPGSKWAEEAQYKLAKSYFLQKDYSTAQIEYDFFLKSYQRSRFADDAAFESAVCNFYESSPYYLDPSLTKKALQEFRSFIKKYADSELIHQAKEYEQKCIDKLVRKDLETAKLYIKIGKKEAAILYLEDLQKNYPNSSYTSEISDLLAELEITP